MRAIHLTTNVSMISALTGLAMFLLIMARVLYFYFASDEQLIGIIPDDAFYYLQMAHHRSVDGFWTFDGVAKATGFHLLYGYFLFWLQTLNETLNWRELFLIIGASSAVLMGVSVYLIAKLTGELFQSSGLALFAVAPFFTAASLIQSTAMMESWLVIFFSALVIYYAVQPDTPSRKHFLFLLFIGCLGSLTRSDFGLLPGMLFITYFIANQFFLREKNWRSAVILLGSVIGLLIFGLHSYLIAGNFFQASARIKLHWSSVAGHSFGEAINIALFSLFPSFFYFDAKWLTAGSLFFLFCLWFSNKNLKGQKNEPVSVAVSKLLPGVACAATIIGYILFYRHNSQSLQYWYVANFIAPSGVLLAALGSILFRKRAWLPGIGLLSVYLISSSTNIGLIQSPHQVAMMEAGKYLATLPTQKQNIAAWNAGIISFFSKHDVINLDGLANDEAYPFILNNNLGDYLKKRNVDYLVDYEEMIRNPLLMKRGGYDAGLRTCMQAEKMFDSPQGKWNQSSLILFRVNLDCLK